MGFVPHAVGALLAAAACIFGGSGIELARVCGDVDVSTVVEQLPTRWITLLAADLRIADAASPSAGRVWALPRGPHVAGSFRDAELADVLPAASLRSAVSGALLRRPHLATSFRDLDAELADVLPVAALRLSHDLAGHLELLRAHCRQRAAAQYHDPDEAALHDRHLASLYQFEFELEHPPDPTPAQVAPLQHRWTDEPTELLAEADADAEDSPVGMRLCPDAPLSCTWWWCRLMQFVRLMQLVRCAWWWCRCRARGGGALVQIVA
nr:uncharacterized protein LOC127304435 [Lolium perenne]